MKSVVTTLIDSITGVTKYIRDGVELEKGVQLTEERILANRELYEKYCNFFTAYPDIFIDIITPTDSTFKLFFYQRIFLRACLRYRYHYCTAPRAFSKTFISTKEKFDEIFSLFPILKKELLSYTSGSDYVKCTFRNGSVFDVVAALDSQRGGRRHF